MFVFCCILDPRTDVLAKSDCGRTIFDMLNRDNMKFADMAFKRLAADTAKFEGRALNQRQRKRYQKSTKLMAMWTDTKVKWSQKKPRCSASTRASSASSTPDKRISLTSPPTSPFRSSLTSLQPRASTRIGTN